MSESPSTVPTVQLNSGVIVARIGFGTFQIAPEDTQRAVEQALELGYRHIDTAAAYYNEAEVGAAVRASGLAREEVFITTKLRNVDQGAQKARDAFKRSQDALGIDVVDLYLIHWPLPSADLYVETWRTLIELQQDGAIRSIGVSNFLPRHLDRLITETGVVPAVNQIEVHPRFSQPDVRTASTQRGLDVEAYSPLGQGADLRDPVVTGIAERLGLTAGQVVLGWHLRAGRLVIPKSAHVDRMRENLASAGSAERLSSEDLAAIDALDRGVAGRIGGDPATFAFPQTREDAVARGEQTA